MARNMIFGLSKLPGYTGKLVRSESLPLDQAVSTYVKGQEFVRKGMLSTSNAGAVAQREGNIAITVQASGKQGKDISQISVHTGKESEILFAPVTRFMVDNAVRVANALVVTLREL